MKTKVYLFAALILLLTPGRGSSQQTSVTNSEVKPGTVTVACTPDLYQQASQWAGQFSAINPAVTIKLEKIAYSDAVPGGDDKLTLISDKSAMSADATNWRVTVGHQVVVPIVNAANPFIQDLMKQGVSQSELQSLFTHPGQPGWGTLLANHQNASLTIYILNEESVKSGLAHFLKSREPAWNGVHYGTREEVLSAVQKDPLSIGFCKAADLQLSDNNSELNGISLLPIDKNGNGTLDYMENIYKDMNTFQRGVWIGKYPKSLCSDLCVLSKVQPVDANSIAFIKWVLADGQQMMVANGYSNLVENESQSQLDMINTINVSEAGTNVSAPWWLIVLAIAAGFIVLSIVISFVVRRTKSAQMPAKGMAVTAIAGFDEKTVSIPEGLYYDKTHTWAFMEKNGRVILGIDDFLQHITGAITRIEMKNPGEKIKKGDLLFTLVQAGKQLNLYAPVSGIIRRQNETLASHTEYLNTSPYMDGWVYEIEPSNWFREIQMMDVAEKYKNWLNTEFSRVKDFLAATLKPDSSEYSYAVLQDGGLLKDGILADFGPEIWEDFQTNFLDTFK